MGNYRLIERDFIERTIKLIEQYIIFIKEMGIKYEEQLNYTLLINCLLGLIVLPKEKIIDKIPDLPISKEVFENIFVNSEIRDLKSLIKKMRNSIAHFDIKIISIDSENNIDLIEFWDRYRGRNNLIAKFKANEMFNFIKFYSKYIVEYYDNEGFD